jgi:hypothetical protein
MASDAARAIRERIKEIDETLAQYRDLVAERKALQVSLDYYNDNKGAVSLFRVPVPTQADLQVVTRFQPRSDSKTTRIVNLVRATLERTPGSAAPFPSVVRMLPIELVGNADHAKEYVRTAIKRAGARVGIVYENGGMVRLVTKNPQVESA